MTEDSPSGFSIENLSEMENAPDWLKEMFDSPWYRWGSISRTSGEAGWPICIKICCLCRAKGVEGFVWTPEDTADATIELKAIPVEHAQTKARSLLYAGECPRCDKVHYMECET